MNPLYEAFKRKIEADLTLYQHVTTITYDDELGRVVALRLENGYQIRAAKDGPYLVLVDPEGREL